MISTRPATTRGRPSSSSSPRCSAPTRPYWSRTVAPLIISIALPLLLLITTDSGKGTDRLGGALFVIGLCTAYGLAATSILGYGLTVARDREKGVFQRLRVTPAPTWAIMGSRLAVQVVANLIIALVVLIVGSAIHNVTFSVRQYVLFLLISVLGWRGFLGIGQAMVGLLKSADTVNAAARLVFIALIVLGLVRPERGARQHVGIHLAMDPGGRGDDALRRSARPLGMG